MRYIIAMEVENI